MLQPHRRSVSFAALLLACTGLVVSCGRTQDSSEPPPLSGAGNATAGEAGVDSTSGGSAPVTGPILSLGGAPAQPPDPPKPTQAVGTCKTSDVPGEPCEDGICWSTRCGVHFQLACQAGAWVVDGSALAFDVTCQPGDEFVHAIRDLTNGACCNDWRPRNNGGEPPSCELCPAETPREGDACSLPGDCSLPIDCFYSCCCYGDLTWAHCDGERWHVATECSGK